MPLVYKLCAPNQCTVRTYIEQTQVSDAPGLGRALIVRLIVCFGHPEDAHQRRQFGFLSPCVGFVDGRFDWAFAGVSQVRKFVSVAPLQSISDPVSQYRSSSPRNGRLTSFGSCAALADFHQRQLYSHRVLLVTSQQSTLANLQKIDRANTVCGATSRLKRCALNAWK